MEQSEKSPMASMESKNLENEELKQGQPQRPKPQDPRVAILQTIQNNLFTDAALQNIGYVILGTAVRKYPDINSPKNRPQEREDAFNKCLEAGETDGYVIGERHLVSFTMSELLDNLDELTDSMGVSIITMLHNSKVVPGTLRVLARLGCRELGLRQNVVELYAVWVEEKAHE